MVDDGKGLNDIDAADIESNYGETTDSFDAMNLKTDLLRGIYACGFERPSALQQHAIMPVIKGNDVIAQTESGTGKTAAFSISILQKIDSDIKGCQALILTANRERAQQIQKVIATIGKFTNIECYACIGGTRIQDNIEALRDGLQSVIVATPGRVHDVMVRHRALYTDNIKRVVLDEADNSISRGFAEHIHTIFGMIRQSMTTQVQVVLFSATMPQDVLEFTTKFMRDPVRIIVDRYEICLKGIKQFYITVENEQEDWKVDSLSDLCKTITDRGAVIFCNTLGMVEWLADKLAARDFPVLAIQDTMTRGEVEQLVDKLAPRGFAVLPIHSNMRADHRDVILRHYRSGSRVLIATNHHAKRIDWVVQQAPLVINFDLPANPEHYMLRVGQGGLGRVGRKGVAINLVAAAEMRTMHEIEQFYSTQIEKMPINNLESLADIVRRYQGKGEDT